ncbi:hypothetical protein HanPSC8_Chr09g0393311 [Helianthus annuus]|nr:hypothetical protein HanPSC8_Chr09g0393311 [Helianthus annuus]
MLTNPVVRNPTGMANPDETSKYKTHTIHRLTPLVLIRMKGSVTSSMSTNLFCKLSKCVCVLCRMCLSPCLLKMK